MEKNAVALLAAIFIVLIAGCAGQFYLKANEVPVVSLAKNTFSQGELVNVTIILPDKDLYTNNYFCSPAFHLYERNAPQQWDRVTTWLSCHEACVNDTVMLLPCYEQCVAGCWKLNASYYIPYYEWDQSIYVLEEGTCGNETGSFEFVTPAPPGEYKFVYPYFEDNECKNYPPKFAEAIFTIE